MPVTINGSGPVTGVTAITGAGLDLITTQSFSAVSSVSVNNCFSATYTNYKVVLISDGTATGSGVPSVSFRLRVDNADDTTTNYYNNFTYTTSAGGPTRAFNSAVNASVLGWVFDLNSGVSMDIYGPQVADFTSWASVCSGWGSADNLTAAGGGFHGRTVSYTGFTFFPASGTITGSLRVYGYRNS